MRRGRMPVTILSILCLSPICPAETPGDPVANELLVQSALQQGRMLLNKGQPKPAIDALEAKLPFINGNTDYLAALRDAYSAYIRELQLNQHDDQIPPVQRKLSLLEAGRSEEHT